MARVGLGTVRAGQDLTRTELSMARTGLNIAKAGPDLASERQNQVKFEQIQSDLAQFRHFRKELTIFFYSFYA